MAGMGPPPKHPSQRRRKNTRDLTPLPATGRKGKSPTWPFDAQTPRERKLWLSLWKTPQAVAWERTHAHREVAAYVRWSLAAEDGDTKAASEARQLADRLALTPLALLRAGYEIVEDDAPMADVVDIADDPRKRLRALRSSA